MTAAPPVVTAETDADVVPDALFEAEADVVVALPMAVIEVVVVAAGIDEVIALVTVVVAVVVATAELEDGAEADPEAEPEVDDPEMELPASTAEQNFSVAGRTWPVATEAPQAWMTQDVAEATTAFSLSQMHL
jgi:hypothetical protein